MQLKKNTKNTRCSLSHPLFQSLSLVLSGLLVKVSFTIVVVVVVGKVPV